MNRDGKTIQELPNEGLDIFINEANLIDMSEYELPFKVTKEIIESKIKDCDKKDLLILRSDLTNKVGYESREWHLKSPSIELEAANWIVDNKFKSVCLDFPQDFIAREMPDRMVYNEEFEIHHKIFDNGITFIEDLMNLGEIANNTTQICAIPLKMDCLDGAPMRTVAIDWF
jgi:kynurenine formamidase